MQSSLPPPDQLKWSHATNTMSILVAALRDASITAIEADIMMGYCTNCDDEVDERENEGKKTKQYEPIMCHPPYTESDVSAAMFLRFVLENGKTSLNTEDKPTGTIREQDKLPTGTIRDEDDKDNSMRSNDDMPLRHIKLDFKDLDSVGEVLIKMIDLPFCPKEGQVIFLNADILPGPGMRNDNVVTVPPDQFIETCLDRIALMMRRNKKAANQFAFSLGYKVDYKSCEAYTKGDAEAMSAIVSKYNLRSCCGGVVLALNARTLAVDPGAFDVFMSAYKEAQMLAWTGSGEPPISQKKIDEIKVHFQTLGCMDRIGFDCDVEAKEDDNIK